MPQQDFQTSPLHIDYVDPKPLPIIMAEILSMLELSQSDLAKAADVSNSVVSHIINNRMTPTTETVKTIHQALVKEFDLPAEKITLDYLLLCRDLSYTEALPDEFIRIDDWLADQSGTIQRNFWTVVNNFIETVEEVKQGK